MFLFFVSKKRIEGYFYFDQLDRLKFCLLRFIIERCWHQMPWFCSVSQFHMHILYKNPRSKRDAFLVGSSFQIVWDFWKSTCSNLGGILISDVVFTDFLLLQTITVLWHNNIRGAVTANAYTVSCHILSHVSFRKLKWVGHRLLWSHGRATCSRTTHHLNRLRWRISWWGFACRQRWKKRQAVYSRKNSLAVTFVFLTSLPALYYRLLVQVPKWVRASVFLVLR